MDSDGIVVIVVIVVMAVVVLLVLLAIRRGVRRARTVRKTVESMTGTAMTGNAFQVQINSAIAAAIERATAATPVSRMNMALPPEGSIGVADVLSVSSLGSGEPDVTLELDAIGAPKRRVMARVTEGQTLARGDRVYVVLDPADPSTVSIAPASMTGGQSLVQGANRLDPLVLGPQILKSGARAKGVVKSAESLPMAESVLAARGFSKWRLELEVTPERGWPYRAELTTSLSTPEKAARIAHAGAQVPLRYDPEDPPTIAIDSVEMGYGNPYENVMAREPGIGSTVTVSVTGYAQVVLIDAGHDKIGVIKALCDVPPGLSLKEAKNFVEGAPSVLKGLVSDAEAEKIRQVLEAAGATVRILQSGAAGGTAFRRSAGERTCSVILTDVGSHRLKVAQALVRIRPDLGLKEIKAIVDDARRGSFTVQEHLSRDDAERHAALLDSAGATVRIQ
jgi:ribosomal protein L7/L12